jgi:hypothetical protein
MAGSGETIAIYELPALAPSHLQAIIATLRPSARTLSLPLRDGGGVEKQVERTEEEADERCRSQRWLG